MFYDAIIKGIKESKFVMELLNVGKEFCYCWSAWFHIKGKKPMWLVIPFLHFYVISNRKTPICTKKESCTVTSLMIYNDQKLKNNTNMGIILWHSDTVATCNADIPYRNWFKPLLFHFQSSSLLINEGHTTAWALPPVWKGWTTLLAAALRLAQPWWLQPFSVGTSRWKTSFCL